MTSLWDQTPCHCVDLPWLHQDLDESVAAIDGVALVADGTPPSVLSRTPTNDPCSSSTTSLSLPNGASRAYLRGPICP